MGFSGLLGIIVVGGLFYMMTRGHMSGGCGHSTGHAGGHSHSGMAGGCCGGSGHDHGHDQHPADLSDESGNDMVKDPVCGMYVDPVTAIVRQVGGKNVFFCSDQCAESYIPQA